MEKIGEFIAANPGVPGIVIAVIGAFILVGAILKWNWIVGEDNARVRTGLFGYIVYKLFGRRVFYIVTGSLICLGGIVWFIALSSLV